MLRLVAWLSAAAYLLANTHASLLVAAILQQPPAVCEDSTSASSEAPTCPHCQKKAGAEQDCRHDTGSRPAQDCPVHSGCPCCPLGDDPCPAPGGCALCSVAKAPCVGSAFVVSIAALPLGEIDAELAPVYVPPICDGLIRPPKA